jgi:hypothetical protein
MAWPTSCSLPSKHPEIAEARDAFTQRFWLVDFPIFAVSLLINKDEKVPLTTTVII